MLLLQLFYLLQREEGAATGWGLLRVAPSPLLKAVRMSAPYVQAQVLLVASAEVAVLTGEGLGSYRNKAKLAALPRGSLVASHYHVDRHYCPLWWVRAERTRPTFILAFLQGFILKATLLTKQIQPTSSFITESGKAAAGTGLSQREWHKEKFICGLGYGEGQRAELCRG